MESEKLVKFFKENKGAIGQMAVGAAGAAVGIVNLVNGSHGNGIVSKASNHSNYSNLADISLGIGVEYFGVMDLINGAARIGMQGLKDHDGIPTLGSPKVFVCAYEAMFGILTDYLKSGFYKTRDLFARVK